MSYATGGLVRKLAVNGVDFTEHVATFTLTFDTSAMRDALDEYLARDPGAAAHANGEPMSACPYAPSDPEGQSWRQGWLRAETAARQQAGTFDHTPAEYADYKRSLGWDDRPDPVVEILGGYDEPEPEPWADATEPWIAPDKWLASIVPAPYSFAFDWESTPQPNLDLLPAWDEHRYAAATSKVDTSWALP